MNKTEWCRACRELAEAQARLPGDRVPVLRDQLAALDRLARAAPWDLKVAYNKLDEAELSKDAKAHAIAIELGGLAWPHKAVGQARALKALAIQIRAVDALLGYLNTRANRPPAASASEWLNSTRDAYVIPSRRRRDLGSAGGDRLGYDRRGTLRHRIIPATLDGMPIRPVAIGSLDASAEERPVTVGAALFPGLSLKTKPSGEGFLAQVVVHPDIGGTISRQVDALSDAHALVWPELTIDDDGLEAIQAALAARAFDVGTGVDVVVAGTWHRARPGGDFNVAPVLDGTGDMKAEYAKVAPFAHDDLGWEAIEQGDRLLVLVCDRFLAAVAICKDYCDLGSSPPWERLDVDLMLVPSMGGETTMAGHLARASRGAIERDQRALVAQHGAPKKEGDPKGFALLGARRPAADPAAFGLDDEWTTAPL